MALKYTIKTVHRHKHLDVLFSTIVECYGNLYKACDELDISYSRMMVWQRKYPMLKQLIENARQEGRQRMIMQSEHTVMRAVNSDNLDAAKFVLKTIGKDQGYTEKQEQDINLNGNIEVSWGDNEKE